MRVYQCDGDGKGCLILSSYASDPTPHSRALPIIPLLDIRAQPKMI